MKRETKGIRRGIEKEQTVGMTAKNCNLIDRIRQTTVVRILETYLVAGLPPHVSASARRSAPSHSPWNENTNRN